MCLAIPGKIIETDNSIEGLEMSLVDFGGIKKEICTEWLDVEPGMYILAHAGVALTVVDEHEALDTLNDLETIAKYLKKNS